MHSDHKPLQTIVNKPLDKSPRRLQGMLMRGQAYNFKLVWKPGKQHVIADTLSRAVDPESHNNGEEMIEKLAALTTYLLMRPEKLEQHYSRMKLKTTSNSTY